MVYIDVSMLIISKHCGCAVVLDDNMILCFARVVHGFTWRTLFAIVYSLNAWIPFIIVKCTNYINTKGFSRSVRSHESHVKSIKSLDCPGRWCGWPFNWVSWRWSAVDPWNCMVGSWKGFFSLSLFGWISEYNSHPSIQQLDLLVATSKI